MVKRVDVHVLYCGQGMTNWIEYFEDDSSTVPTATAFVDIGGRGTDSDRAAEFIAERLLGFPSASRKIGALIISHQDSDHWELIDYLRSLIKDQGVTCRKAYLGGALWSSRAKESVFKFCEKTGASVTFLPRLSSAYIKKSYAPLVAKGRFRLQLVIANVPSAYKSPSLIRNGTSAVIAVELIGSKSVILPGDAMFETMNVMNKIYASAKKPLPCSASASPITARSPPRSSAMRPRKKPRT